MSQNPQSQGERPQSTNAGAQRNTLMMVLPIKTGRQIHPNRLGSPIRPRRGRPRHDRHTQDIPNLNRTFHRHLLHRLDANPNSRPLLRDGRPPTTRVLSFPTQVRDRLACNLSLQAVVPEFLLSSQAVAVLVFLLNILEVLGLVSNSNTQPVINPHHQLTLRGPIRPGAVAFVWGTQLAGRTMFESP